MTVSRYGLAAISTVALPTVIISSIRQDYTHLDQSFSELGMLHEPYFLLFNFLVFILGGLLILAFISKLDTIFPIRRRQKTWLTVAASGWIGTGIFPLSYDNQLLYILHLTPAVICYVCAGMGMIDWGYHLNNHEGFELHGFLTMIMGFLTWTFILVGEPTISAELAQLLTIASFYIWVAIISLLAYIRDQ